MKTFKINMHVKKHAVQGPFSLQVLWFKKEGFLVPLPIILSGTTAFCCWGICLAQTIFGVSNKAFLA